MKTTLAAPGGAFGGSNGAQSGSESRMSTLIVPLNGSPIRILPRSSWQEFRLRRERSPAQPHNASCRSGDSDGTVQRSCEGTPNNKVPPYHIDAAANLSD